MKTLIDSAFFMIPKLLYWAFMAYVWGFGAIFIWEALT